MIKRILIWLLVVMLMIFSGAFLISIVHLINSPKIKENVLESGKTLSKEDVYQKANLLSTSTLDNHTDALMLLIASYQGEEPLVAKGMNNYRLYKEGLSPYEQLTSESDIPETVIPYYRYWHGYTIILRPLLVFFNYNEIRTINLVMQFIILTVIISLMLKRKLGWYIVPFISAYVLLNPHAISMSLQNSTIWYITCISIIIYLIFKDKIVKYKLHYILFTIVGMLTSYMDFLTYPIVTFGMLIIIVLLAEDLRLKDAINSVLLAGTFWVLGYGIMWASKWLLASMLLNIDVIKNALDAVNYRSSTKMIGSDNFLRIDALKQAFSVYDLNIIKIILAANLLDIITIILTNIEKYKINQIEENLQKSFPIFLLLFLPIIWYFILANHTMKHPFLSFRTGVILWFAVLIFIFRLIIVKQEILLIGDGKEE